MAPGVLDHVKVTGTPTVVLVELAVNAVLKLPLPDKLTVSGAAPPFTRKVAETGPTAAGLNTTLIVQFVPTATEVLQVLVCENG